MSTIATGNTLSTTITITGDTTGNLTLAPLSGKQVILTQPLQFSDGTSMSTAAVGGGGPGTFQAIQSANFTATANSIYAVNTTAATIYVNLPASPSVGQYVTFIDFARKFGTNPLVINPNGSLVEGISNTSTIGVNGAAVSAIYSGAVQGWLQYSGVSTPQIGGYAANYLVAAGGGGGANYNSAGGGGAGGLLTGIATLVPGATYSITIGAGGSAGTGSGLFNQTNGGNSSVIGTSANILSIGGGAGGNNGATAPSGGSGGGGGGNGTPGSGTVGQGNAGGTGAYGTYYACGGGGGASAVGGNAVLATSGGNGGAGSASTISGSSVYYCGGGGGSTQVGGTGGTGGTGGGGTGGDGSVLNGTAGTTNTGGGGGAGGYVAGIGTGNGGAGGSGIVILSYQGSQRGSGGTVTSAAGYTIHTFTSSGTYTA